MKTGSKQYQSYHSVILLVKTDISLLLFVGSYIRVAEQAEYNLALSSSSRDTLESRV